LDISCTKVGHGTPAETAVMGHVWQGESKAQRAYVRVAKSDGEYVSEVRCADGSFYIPMLPGDWRVTCFAPHGQSASQRLSVLRGDQFDIEFRL